MAVAAGENMIVKCLHSQALSRKNDDLALNASILHKCTLLNLCTFLAQVLTESYIPSTGDNESNCLNGCLIPFMAAKHLLLSQNISYTHVLMHAHACITSAPLPVAKAATMQRERDCWRPAQVGLMVVWV